MLSTADAAQVVAALERLRVLGVHASDPAFQALARVLRQQLVKQEEEKEEEKVKEKQEKFTLSPLPSLSTAFFSASESRAVQVDCALRARGIPKGCERIVFSVDSCVLSLDQLRELQLQVLAARHLPRNAPLPARILHGIRACGDAAKTHRNWLLSRCEQDEVKDREREKSGGDDVGGATKENSSISAATAAAAASASISAPVSRAVEHLGRVAALSLPAGLALGSAMKLPAADQWKVVEQANIRENRIRQKIKMRQQELQMLLQPTPQPLELEAQIADAAARAAQAAQRLEQIRDEKTTLLSKLNSESADTEMVNADGTTNSSSGITTSANGSTSSGGATGNANGGPGNGSGSGSGSTSFGLSLNTASSSTSTLGAGSQVLPQNGAASTNSEKAHTSSTPSPINGSAVGADCTIMAAPAQYASELAPTLRVQASLELAALRLHRVQRDIRQQVIDDSRRNLLPMAVREDASHGLGSGSGYTASGASYSALISKGRNADSVQSFSQFSLRRSRGHGRDAVLHPLDSAINRRSGKNAFGQPVDSSSVLADTAMTSAAGMLARVQARAAARKERHFEFLQGVFDHGRGFVEWNASVARIRKRLCKDIKQYFTVEERKKLQREELEERKRLQALRENNEEEYMKLLENTKNERLQMLLAQTNAFMDQIAQRVARVKDVDQYQEQKEARDRRLKGTGEGRGKKKTGAAEDEEEEFEEVAHGEVGGESSGQKGARYYTSAHSVEERVIVQPSSLKFGKLKAYQVAGLHWLVSLYNNNLNGILADEMGLGKTIQTIALVAHLMEYKQNFGPYLIIVPLSTMSNWVVEFARWFPDCMMVDYQGLPDDRRKLFRDVVQTRQCNVLLTSYEMCIKDEKLLNKVEWQYVIIDEGHRIKNRGSKLATVLRGFLSHHRLLLTGTPLQNDITELWSLLNFLLPSIFQNAGAFEDWFNAPFSAAKPIAAKEDEIENSMEPTDEEKMLIIMQLHKVLRPFLLRRLKTEVEHELPEKQEIVLKCSMSAMQRSYYNLMVRDGVMLLDPTRNTLGKNKAKQGFNNTLMQLKKICNHPYLFLEEYTLDENMVRVSGKFELLDRTLHKLKALGHRVLMFTQMTSILDVFEEYLWLRGFGNQVRPHPYEPEEDYAAHEQMLADARDQADAAIAEQRRLKAGRASARKAEEASLRGKETPTQARIRKRRYAEEDAQDAREITFEDFLPPKDVEYLRLDGHTGAAQRRELMLQWNEPDSPYWLFVLSTKAGGLGLNLQTADTVIIFDSDWNPQMDLQAQDRAHRIGQTREVRVYRLITAGTVEEKIFERADWKLKMDQKVIQAGMFDHQQDGTERSKKKLQQLFAIEEDDSHHDVFEDEEALNQLIARGDHELVAFAEADKLRRAREQDNELYAQSRLMTKEELPEYIIRGEQDAEDDRSGVGEAARLMAQFETSGRGKRERKDVVYDDGLTELQFARQVDKGILPSATRRVRRRSHESSEDEEASRKSKSKRKHKDKKGKKDKKRKHQSKSKRGKQESDSRKRRRSSRGASNIADSIEEDLESDYEASENAVSRVKPSAGNGARGEPQKKRRRVVVEPQFPEEGWEDLAPVSQTAGIMFDAYQLWDELQSEPANELFLELPDPEEYGFYYDAIKYPVSLAQVRWKIENGTYGTRAADFCKDLLQICENASTFNEDGSPLFVAAAAMRERVEAWALEYAPDAFGAPPPPAAPVSSADAADVTADVDME